MPANGFYRIVVAVDFSTASAEAWRLARRMASPSDAELVLTHVMPAPPRLGGIPSARAQPGRGARLTASVGRGQAPALGG